MTVSSAVSKSGPYTGNGSTTVFAYGFRILNQTHLQVIRTSVDGVDTTLTLGTHYTVSGVGSSGGGNVTTLTAPASGEQITILRNVPFTQNTDLENQGAYYAQVVEDALDLAAMRDQQMEEKLSRAITLPVTSGEEGSDLGSELSEAILTLGPVADDVVAVAGIAADVTTAAGISADISTVAAAAAVLTGTASAVDMVEDLFTGDGTDTTWTLTRAPSSEENVLVFVGGAIQSTGDYSVSGTTLTISPAVANGVEIRALTMTLVSSNSVQAIADAAAASAASAASTLAGAVRHDTSQSLSSGAKTQAQTNIGGTTVGRSVFSAADAAAARSTIGTVAKAGDTFTGAVAITGAGVSTTAAGTQGNGLTSNFNGGTLQRALFYGTAGVFPIAAVVAAVDTANSQQSFLLFNSAGALTVPGALSKASGTFLIDHPLDPFNRDLAHGFVEAPEYQNRYRGRVRLAGGRATVNIDTAAGMTAGTFAALNADAWVAGLQNQDGFARLRPGPLVGATFEIICEDDTSTDLVAWEVTARRNDAFVRSTLDPNTDSAGNFVCERDKPE